MSFNVIDSSPWGGKKVVPDGHYKENLRSTYRNSMFDMVQVIDDLKVKKKHSRFMIHPASSFISCWYIIASLLLFYIFLTVPLFLAFDYILSRSYLWMDIFIDVFFIVDIVVSFRTGYLPNPARPDLVVMNGNEVAMMYLRRWFFIDFISSVPLVTFGAVVTQTSFANSPLFQEQQLKLLKLTRVIRLIKLSKLSTSFGKFARVIDQAYVRLMVAYPGLVIFLQLANLFFIAFFIVHYVACGWWMIGDMHEVSWSSEVGAKESSPGRQYMYSLYWVVTTMTTVGYGDISATNDSERAFAIFAMVLGCAFYGLLIAQITSIVAEYDAHRRAIAERLDAISAYVHNKDFHPVLQKHILIYFRNFLRKHSTVDEWQILTDMSSGLRRQCIHHLVSPAVARNPFFFLLKDHITELYHIMHLQVMDRGQHITRKGQPSSDLMVLMVGSAVILDESAESVRQGQGDPIFPLFDVKPGAVFGERCVLGMDECYPTTIRALSNCELNVIFADELLATLGNRILEELRERFRDPSYRVRIRAYAIGNIENHAMPDLRRAIFELPADPIGRTWSRRSKSDQEKYKIRRRHPGRQTSTAEVLTASILQLRERNLATALKKKKKEASGETSTNTLENDNRITEEVALLSQSVGDIREGLNQILAHLNKPQIPERRSSTSSSNTIDFEENPEGGIGWTFPKCSSNPSIHTPKANEGHHPSNHNEMLIVEEDSFGEQSIDKNDVPREQSVVSTESSDGGSIDGQGSYCGKGVSRVLNASTLDSSHSEHLRRNKSRLPASFQASAFLPKTLSQEGVEETEEPKTIESHIEFVDVKDS